LSLTQPIHKIEIPLRSLVLSTLRDRSNGGERLDKVRDDIILLEDTNRIYAVENSSRRERSRTSRNDLALDSIQAILGIQLSPSSKLVSICTIRLIGLEV